MKESNVRCLEVVAELKTMSDFVRVKKEVVEGLLRLDEGGCDVKRQLVVEDSHDAQSFKHL